MGIKIDSSTFEKARIFEYLTKENSPECYFLLTFRTSRLKIRKRKGIGNLFLKLE